MPLFLFIFNIFYNMHTFISHSYNTFIHRHLLGPLSISSLLESSVGRPSLWCRALQQADALPTEPRRTITEPRRTIKGQKRWTELWNMDTRPPFARMHIAHYGTAIMMFFKENYRDSWVYRCNSIRHFCNKRKKFQKLLLWAKNFLFPMLILKLLRKMQKIANKKL